MDNFNNLHDVLAEIGGLKLNGLITDDYKLTHDGLVADRERAHGMAIIEAPHMELAAGRLATRNYFNVLGHQNSLLTFKECGLPVEPALPYPISPIRENVYFARGLLYMYAARQAVRQAYRASAHLA